MEPNSQRGETSIKIAGKDYTFAVTLGGLAAVETILGTDKPEELTAALNMMSNRTTAKMLSALINHHSGTDTITEAEILRSGLLRYEARRAIEAAMMATADPEDIAKAREGNVGRRELEEIKEEMINLAARIGALRGQFGSALD